MEIFPLISLIISKYPRHISCYTEILEIFAAFTSLYFQNTRATILVVPTYYIICGPLRCFQQLPRPCRFLRTAYVRLKNMDHWYLSPQSSLSACFLIPFVLPNGCLCHNRHTSMPCIPSSSEHQLLNRTLYKSYTERLS